MTAGRVVPGGPGGTSREWPLVRATPRLRLRWITGGGRGLATVPSGSGHQPRTVPAAGARSKVQFSHTCAGEVSVSSARSDSHVSSRLGKPPSSAKEGVTAVASAQGSAARRQPSQQGQGRRAPHARGGARKGDAPVTLVGADEPHGRGRRTGPARQKGSRSGGRSVPHARCRAGDGRRRRAAGTAGRASGASAEAAPKDASRGPGQPRARRWHPMGTHAWKRLTST